MKAIVLLATLLLCACSNEDDVLRMGLPKDLKEISGLATFENNLLAIADEKARVYKISFEEETVERVGAFGDPPVKGDFEGIAVAGNTVYAITSEGMLFIRAMDDADERFERQDTALGELCEIEGLDWYEGILYVLCKTAYVDELKNQLSILAWNPKDQVRSADHELHLSWLQLELPKKQLHPSGIVVNSEMILVIAAKERVWVKFDRQTNKTVVGRLSKSHNQAEGIAVQHNAMYIADEGKKRGSVTRYPGAF